jgi:hypothetical protein
MIDPALVSEVREWIEVGGPVDPARFGRLCLSIARAQGLIPDREGYGADGWEPSDGTAHGGDVLDRIEPVPETAFKLMTVAHFAPSEAEAVFRTSGTTTGNPGRHLVKDMSLYRDSVLQGFRTFVMYDPAPVRLASLIPPAEERPGSSLSHMISMVCDAFATGPVSWIRQGDALDLDALLDCMAGAESSGEPVAIMGTTLDFLTMFDALRSVGRTFRLPSGSRAMHTGGAKSSGRALSRADLHRDLDAMLGVPPDDAVEEYGMTELMSQAYDSPRVTPGPRRMVGVPWMRTRVLDPRTMADVPDGTRGVLCHYDLANCHTAVAVITGDLSTRIRDGFTDVARSTGAGPRGCSSEASVRAE